MPAGNSTDYDVLIIGSGFGGSVAAMRLTRKGYRVGVLEMGRRYRWSDFPKSNWSIWRFLWAPLLRCFGFQSILFMKGLMLLRGVGVGGGSLVYAAVLMRPPSHVFKSREWPAGREGDGRIDWEAELNPYYAEASHMLGVVPTPRMEAADQALREVGARLGVADSFHATDVGIHFGGQPSDLGSREARAPFLEDPYFGGEGPLRGTCNFCGGCMVGCRRGAKNTLDTNYLWFAERAGAVVHPETKATRLLPQKDGSWRVETIRSTSWPGRGGRTFRARKVILAAGVMGTLDLLFRNKQKYGTLPRLSPALGDNVRTNGESLVGATSFKAGATYSRGVAIGSAIHPDPDTKIEAVRYPSGSGAMRLLAGPLAPAGGKLTRPFKLMFAILLRTPRLLRLLTVKDWARNSVILLVMQSIDQKMRVRWGRSFWNPITRALRGEPAGRPIPSYLEVAQQGAVALARELKGEPMNALSETLLSTPATAHILGGCCMADGPEQGVVSSSHEVFGHPGLYVCDGSVIPANLAVNPSLTITALAERFAAQWPEKRNP